ncbi:hypothetical protein CAMGR0001_2475 [Campylobacter gracilis RM3268]|uniref:Uncharacterized protein n=1 Tax=Campylobacter gracilis RM3268 TaxID=553220 RepID=C8PFC2_9BACT|nr:hypothetical protein CAMGR0001_2475 [Campylobacter gracilis RM3268]
MIACRPRLICSFIVRKKEARSSYVFACCEYLFACYAEFLPLINKLTLRKISGAKLQNSKSKPFFKICMPKFYR